MKQGPQFGAHATADLSGAFRSFERILRPTNASFFLTNHFERSILHVARNSPDYFDDLYSVAAFEQGLSVASQFAQHLVEATKTKEVDPKSGESRSDSCLPFRDIDSFGSDQVTHTSPLHPRKLSEAFSKGSTLVLNRAGSFFSPLNNFCRALEFELGFKVRANAYLTPSDNQGFRLHHDTHDTIILQIEGSKYWSIFEPQRSLPMEDEFNRLSAPVRPTIQLLLQAGDTLYLPRGTPHEAQAAHVRSLHITLGLYQPRFCDLLMLVVKQAARADPALRRGLYPGWQHSARQQLVNEVRSYTEPIKSSEYIAAALDDLAVQTTLDAIWESEGYISTLDGLNYLRETALIEMRGGVAYQIRDCLFYLELVASGSVLILPASYATAIEQIRRAPIVLGALSGLTAAERLQLAKQLVTIGVARIVHSGEPAGGLTAP